MSGSCTSGKRAFESYAEALAALSALAATGTMRGPVGSIYTCTSCEMFHISSRVFTLTKPKGRGKKRRRLVRFEKGA
jgi:hypothetical protein